MVKDFIVKNMVCDRCIRVLTNEMKLNNIQLMEIELGHLKVDIQKASDTKKIADILEKNGFSIIDSLEEKLTEQVKIALIKLVQIPPIDLNTKLSYYLANKLGHDYSKISKAFSYTEGLTIEKYFIKLKIEKVKELIQANEINFTEMAQLLDYSHINHLSRQFKSETGMSLSDYKSHQRSLRTSLDQIM